MDSPFAGGGAKVVPLLPPPRHSTVAPAGAPPRWFPLPSEPRPGLPPTAPGWSALPPDPLSHPYRRRCRLAGFLRDCATMTPDWPLSSTTLPLPSPSLNTHAPVSARMLSCLVEGGQQSNPSEMGWNPATREPQRW
jgi:hypothetical protein